MKARWVSLALGVIVIATVVAGLTLWSPPPELSSTTAGDPRLVARVQSELTGIRDRAAVCIVEPGEEPRYAFFGADERTGFEIGSITKAITGELLADAVARGEVSLDTTVGSLLDLDGSEVADVTLEQLATHTSGLGEWGNDSVDGGLEHWWTENVRGDTTHDISLDALLERARTDPLATSGTFSYSNIGVAVLGHALAEAAGTDYATLFRARVTAPLGLNQTWLASDADVNRPRGFDLSGRRVPAWNLGAYAPSGGGFSTIADTCALAGALLDAEQDTPEPDPGDAAPQDEPARLSARDPVFVDSVGDGVGLGWYTRTVGDETVAWKEGTTGGFATIMAVGPTIGVVVLTNTATPVDDLLWSLVEDPP